MTRKEFLSFIGLTFLSMQIRAEDTPVSKMPALFLGHGSPMNIVEDNDYTRTLKALGKRLQPPKAILVVSAHWYPTESLISSDERPGLLYDFFGFPDELYAIRYDAPGDPKLADMIAHRIDTVTTRSRKLDHGSWALLHHLFPDAQIPVLQLSINRNLSMSGHFFLGQELAFLRHLGVLIIGSGNVTHNLQEARSHGSTTPKWAEAFDAYVGEAMEERKFDRLIDYRLAGESAAMAHPTDEHFVPLLYIAGLLSDDEEVKTVYEGFQNGSISMKGWQIG